MQAEGSAGSVRDKRSEEVRFGGGQRRYERSEDYTRTTPTPADKVVDRVTELLMLPGWAGLADNLGGL